jgi:hypothetical protein
MRSGFSGGIMRERARACEACHTWHRRPVNCQPDSYHPQIENRLFDLNSHLHQYL